MTGRRRGDVAGIRCPCCGGIPAESGHNTYVCPWCRVRFTITRERVKKGRRLQKVMEISVEEAMRRILRLPKPPEWFYNFLSNYANALKLGIRRDEAWEVARKLTLERFADEKDEILRVIRKRGSDE